MKNRGKSMCKKNLYAVVKNGNRVLDTVENLETGGVRDLSGVRNIHVTPGRMACRGDLEQLATRSFYRGVAYERSSYGDSEVPEKVITNEVGVAFDGLPVDDWYLPVVVKRTVVVVAVSWIIVLLLAVLSVISGYIMQFGAGLFK